MPLNRATALDALRSGDLLELGMSGNQLRWKLHPEGVVTYALDGASSPKQVGDGATHEESISLGNMPHIAHASLDGLKSLLVNAQTQVPGVVFQQLPVSAHHRFAHDLCALSEALPNLQNAGLESIHIELEAARFVGFSRDGLRSLLHAAAANRLFVSASIAIGNGESFESRIDTLELLRELQQDSNTVRTVLVRIHHSNAPDARREEEATAVDYLRMVAVTRLLVGNIEHLQTDWSVMGPKVLELALCFGANDAGTVPRSQAGSKEPSHHGGESEIRRIIRDAGFRPVERDALFRQSLLH